MLLFQFAPVIDTLSLVYLTLFKFLFVFSLIEGLVKGCELGRALEECGRGWGERFCVIVIIFHIVNFFLVGRGFFSDLGVFHVNSCVVLIVLLFL